MLVAKLVADSIEVAPDLMSPLIVQTGGHFIRSSPPWQIGLILCNRDTGRKYRVTVEELGEYRTGSRK